MSEVLQMGEELTFCAKERCKVTDENAENAMEEFIWKKMVSKTIPNRRRVKNIMGLDQWAYCKAS